MQTYSERIRISTHEEAKKTNNEAEMELASGQLDLIQMQLDKQQQKLPRPRKTSANESQRKLPRTRTRTNTNLFSRSDDYLKTVKIAKKKGGYWAEDGQLTSPSIIKFCDYVFPISVDPDK